MSKSTVVPGYHLSVIPRGRLGYWSKVVEEALEARDASQQRVRLMVLVELSDMVGAMEACLSRHGASLSSLETVPPITDKVTIDTIVDHVVELSTAPTSISIPPETMKSRMLYLRSLVEAYLARSHPGVTWGDLRAMAEVTGRAFRSGRRK